MEHAGSAPNHVWSYDFISTVTADGSSLRILNVVDEYTRRALACRVESTATSAPATSSPASPRVPRTRKALLHPL